MMIRNQTSHASDVAQGRTGEGDRPHAKGQNNIVASLSFLVVHCELCAQCVLCVHGEQSKKLGVGCPLPPSMATLLCSCMECPTL